MVAVAAVLEVMYRQRELVLAETLMAVPVVFMAVLAKLHTLRPVSLVVVVAAAIMVTMAQAVAELRISASTFKGV